MMTIKAVGPGCPNSHNFEMIARKAVASMKVDATVERVTDLRDITKYAILATAGVVINERMVCAGRVPSEAEVVSWLATAANE